MTVREYLEKLEKIEERAVTLKLQIELMGALKAKYTFEKYTVGQEYLCTYDIEELWDEYSVKLKKCLYFLEKYCVGMRNEIVMHLENLKGADIGLCPSYHMQEAIFNFDAFILSACAMVDNEEKDYLAAYLRKTNIREFYPDRREIIGLYWQLNLLRNRIIHHTGGRYINSEVCQRFFDFSSHVRMIRVVSGHLYLECTQIDIHMSKRVQEIIKKEIECDSRNNIFDELFPDRKAKGKNKKSPVMIMPDEQIYFDHVYGGQWVAGTVQDFMYKITQAFFVEFYDAIKDKDSIAELGINYVENGEACRVRVKDVFNIAAVQQEK